MEGFVYEETRIIRLGTDDYHAKIHRAYVHESLWKAKCFRANDDLSYRDAKDWPIPRAPFERHRVFTGLWGKGTYST